MNYEETVTKINEALESIRPFLKKDGGDIELIEIKDDTAFVKFQGTCVECPMNFSTLKLGVENTVKQFAPEIKEVCTVE